MDIAVHLIDKERAMTPAGLGNTTYVSEGWTVKSAHDAQLVGARIFFHEKKTDRSYYGGTISGVRRVDGAVTFTFDVSQDAKDVGTNGEGWSRGVKITADGQPLQAPISQRSARLAKPRTVNPGASLDVLASQAAVDAVAAAFLRLPNADTVGVAQDRLERQASAAERTVADAWKQFVVSGFSSRERSHVGSRLHRFATDPESVYPLRVLCEAQKRGNGFDVWATTEVERVFPGRGVSNKIELALKNFAHFRKLQPGTLLRDLSNAEAGPLVQLRDLAETGSLLRQLDDVLERSAEASLLLDDEHFPQVGLKQYRNILCSLGLLKNALPIDSRWGNWLHANAGIELADRLGSAKYYLCVENLLRKALVNAQQHGRDDLLNMGVLDAVVFWQKEPPRVA